MDLSHNLTTKITDEKIIKIIKNPLKNIPKIETSIEISQKFKIALHPNYIFFWNEISSTHFISFLENLKKIKLTKNNETEIQIEIINNEYKEDFEKLGVEHKIVRKKVENFSETDSSIIFINDLNSKKLLSNLGIYEFSNFNKNEFLKIIENLILISKENLELSVIEILNKNEFCIIEIRDLGGSYIGSRMGRPEKAKPRDGFKIDGKIERPHGLFPLGNQSGRLKNIYEAYEKYGFCETDIQVFENENEEEFLYQKEFENKELLDKEVLNKEVFFKKWTTEKLVEKTEDSVKFKKFKIDLKNELKIVRKVLRQNELSKDIKGISVLESKNKSCEHISKSYLREKNGIKVNKDGTCRYDMIEMGLTHFKPIEIETSVSKLKELGYDKDYLGEKITNENQIIEIFPQDVILPDCPKSDDMKASDFILKVGNFVDEELELLYKQKKYFNFKTKNDTIGHLIIGLAPHTSAGIIGRIIGYSKTQGCFSHPVWHAAQRRNLDGDENGIILLLDGIINFSKEYLPDRRGRKTMDTSLVLTTNLHLDQIDDEVYGVDIVKNYDLEFYKEAKKYTEAKKIKVKKINDKINVKNLDEKYFDYYFTHNVTNFNKTVLYSSYKSVPIMNDKMNLQLNLGKKIRAVNENKVGDLIIDKHFLKDIKGNLRKFGMQTFRCPNCNTIFRRPPLNGKCKKCKKDNIIFTINEGGIKKYLKPSFNIIKNYNINPYLVETIELVKLRIDGVFGEEKKEEKKITDFFGK